MGRLEQEYGLKGHGMMGTHRLLWNILRWMFKKLWRNRDKKNWLLADPDFLMDKLWEEYREFCLDPSWEEAADMANVAAMIVDLKEKRIGNA